MPKEGFNGELMCYAKNTKGREAEKEAFLTASLWPAC